MTDIDVAALRALLTDAVLASGQKLSTTVVIEQVEARLSRVTQADYMSVRADALRQMVALRNAAPALLDEIERLRVKVRGQFTATFAKLREELGEDLGSGGGLVGIIDGIDRLRSRIAALERFAHAMADVLIQSGPQHGTDIARKFKRAALDAAKEPGDG